METRRVLGLVCLSLFSILIIQKSHFPYEALLSSSGKVYSTFNGGGDDRVTGRDGTPSQLKYNLSVAVNIPTPEDNYGCSDKSRNVSGGSRTGFAPPAAPDSGVSPPSPGYPANNSDSLSESDRKMIVPSDDIVAENVSLPTAVAGGGGVAATAAAAVVSISEMNDMLRQNNALFFTKSPLWQSLADDELSAARVQIQQAPKINHHPTLHVSIYRNLSTFVRSYEIMERKLKVYIYKEGERPVFHKPKLRGIYASEGWFMKHMKSSNNFLTTNPQKAHLFYFPFSSQLLAEHIYVRNSHSFVDIDKYLNNYLNTIKRKYPFWNRTDGADHFLVACHDWAPYETKHRMSNCLRALCNADVKEGFHFGKDVSLAETYIHSPKNPMRSTGGEPPSRREVLAFFAGQMHGELRPILLKQWENKDSEMKIFGKINKKSYIWYMKNSKYCICAKGYEVNSPRVVESIIYGCVPVIISDNFVPPFFDILNWEAFTIFVPEKDIPNLKRILESIPEKKYLVMYKRVEQVRLHFVWHKEPIKYDIFHMILHSIWYNRVSRSPLR
ncbi:probable glycosyltransferase At5g03795 [Andrographis paniculata]|uniref:probable glycosyltransferase At5g03795 n=1 Tax=Andrographis paniculata TaxID=175694 RepID=UPI0021E90DEE|nr:probable glycosyltransferase At5g03795 [Andrographis paniculata]XP_051119386.1 probable glycosyltransferase At5g03795 [Andrographis paniculata]